MLDVGWQRENEWMNEREGGGGIKKMLDVGWQRKWMNEWRRRRNKKC